MKMTSFSLKEVLRIPEQLLCYNTVKIHGTESFVCF